MSRWWYCPAAGRVCPVKASPYFMAGLERFERFPGSPDARLLERKLAQKGAHNIAWLYTRRQGIFFTSGRRPLRELEDFRGIKLRGVSLLFVVQGDLGAVAFGELNRYLLVSIPPFALWLPDTRFG